MRLIDNAILQRLRGDDLWILINPFRVELDDGRMIVVPVGFTTDKASVPRIVWPIIPRDDRFIIDAALAHDFLYIEQKIDGQWIKRSQADAIFKAIMKYSGMGWFRRQIAYAGVRTGGWVTFNPRAKKLGNPYYQ